MNEIYIFGVYTHTKSYLNNAEECGDTLGYAYDECLNEIAQHYSSGINWTKHDMGITSDWKHDTYKKTYLTGYFLVWLGCFETKEEGINKIKEALC